MVSAFKTIMEYPLSYHPLLLTECNYSTCIYLCGTVCDIGIGEESQPTPVAKCRIITC